DWKDFTKNYDFPFIAGISRALQFCCCLIQKQHYNESELWSRDVERARGTRYYNIDGRFDLRQLMREPENTVKIQYSIALFTPTVLSVLIFACVHQHYGLIRFLWRITCLTEIGLAVGLLGLEAFEVFVKGN
ncbi:hypothetical protein COOONC_24323, partial [Cooperia oncophora]